MKNKNLIPLEIERKFIPKNYNKEWETDIVSSELLFQTYFNDENNMPYRVRLHLEKKNHKTGIIDTHMHAVSCYKNLIDNINGVPIYTEVEESLDWNKAVEIIKNNTNKLIVKRRSCVPFHEFMFEIDEYLTHNVILFSSETEAVEKKLHTIEVEFEKIEDVEIFNSYIMPTWLGMEVTNNKNYKNSHLAKSEKNKNFLNLESFFLDKLIITELVKCSRENIKPKF